MKQFERLVPTKLEAFSLTRAKAREGCLHDLLPGRVLGRALAHEIGHFLLQSRDHAATGLMRARQWTPDLVPPDRRRFGLSAVEVSRLTSIASSGYLPE